MKLQLPFTKVSRHFYGQRVRSSCFLPQEQDDKTKVEKELITLFRKDFFVHTAAAANKRKNLSECTMRRVSSSQSDLP
jgi:hypothetical protein